MGSEMCIRDSYLSITHRQTRANNQDNQTRHCHRTGIEISSNLQIEVHRSGNVLLCFRVFLCLPLRMRCIEDWVTTKYTKHTKNLAWYQVLKACNVTAKTMGMQNAKPMVTPPTNINTIPMIASTPATTEAESNSGFRLPSCTGAFSGGS